MLQNQHFTEAEPEIVEEQPKKYVPPTKRIVVPKEDEQPNLQDADQFPSLMAAETISKKELEKKKLRLLSKYYRFLSLIFLIRYCTNFRALEEKKFEENQKEMARKRQEAMIGVAKIQEKETDKSKATIVPEKVEEKTNSVANSAPAPQKYVPPHLRK